jgi:hypothetical protein
MMLINKTHRIVVLDEKNCPVSMITQTRVLKIASVMLDQMPAAKQTLEQLQLDRKEVVSVPESALAHEAFKKMVDNVSVNMSSSAPPPVVC